MFGKRQWLEWARWMVFWCPGWVTIRMREMENKYYSRQSERKCVFEIYANCKLNWEIKIDRQWNFVIAFFCMCTGNFIAFASVCVQAHILIAHCHANFIQIAILNNNSFHFPIFSPVSGMAAKLLSYLPCSMQCKLLFVPTNTLLLYYCCFFFAISDCLGLL